MRSQILSFLLPIGLTCMLAACEAEKEEMMEEIANEKAAAMEKVNMSKSEWKAKVKESCPKKKFKDKEARKKCIAALKSKG